ncbi:MAG: molecular chaperone SurA [Proteobacteria bacterium]|nr:MAG: molecular chaperone SurA [Pseudomonadota bacterium]
MNAYRILLGVAVCGALTVPAAAQDRPGSIAAVDRVVAVVNDDVITRIELDRESRMAVEQLRRQGTPLPARDILEKQLLERMINKRILLQYAQQTGLRVSDPDLERAIERIAQENKLTPATLRETVERDGLSFNRFREDVRGEMLMARLRDREVDNRLVVSDDEIQSFLRSQQSQGDKVDEYNLSHILVTVPEQATAEELKARRGRADTALAQLRQGADFRQVTASFSDAPDALQGGDMGWRPAARLPTIFLDALKTMVVGQTSEVLRSPAGFHIIKLIDKRGSETPVVMTQTHARHILIRLNEVVSENDARNRLNDLKDRIEHGADFGELARLHSDDASAARGGDLGWVTPGDVVPDFEHAMDALKPGQVSAPFKSPFGWHIVQVLERRQQDMTKDRQRLAARQSLKQRKSEDQWQEWIRQQRDKAYVEYHLDDR